LETRIEGKFIIFKINLTNINNSFAFIDFETSEEKDKAIAMSESIFFKRPLLIKDSKDFNKKGRTKAPEDSKNSKTQQAAFLRSQSHEPSATLFIGNLPFECTSDFLMEKFKIYGNVKKVRLATFEDTNRCKG
jgi:RNA recognition motif-containing protein